MFVFRKIWHSLFSCNTRFEIRPFALLPTPLWKCSSRAENSQLIYITNFCLVMIDNLTISNCTADKSVTVSWTINQTFPDDVNNVTYLEDYQKSGIWWEFDKVSNAFSLKTFCNTRCRQKHAQIRNKDKRGTRNELFTLNK